MIAPVAPRPAGLPDAVKWCPTHRAAWLPSVRARCPSCASATAATQDAVPRVARPRTGALDEARLCAVLDAAGLIDAMNATPATPVASVYIRELAWGVYLPEPRLFRFDAALVVRRLAFELDGGAHAAGKRKVRTDTERRGLAAAHGWRVVAMTPEQVRDGTALGLVRAALGGA